jgi:alanine racemase
MSRIKEGVYITEVIPVQTEMYRSTYAEVNLQAIKDNFFALKKRIGEQSDVMPVIKANAYGHGVIPVANTVVAAGAKYLAVSSLEEALEIRYADITVPILIFGYVPIEFANLIVKYNLTVTVFDIQIIKELDRLAFSQQKTAKIHVKVDTGMGRVGITDVNQFKEIVQLVKNSPNVLLEGIYTHFACADEIDKSHTEQQHNKFKVYIVEAMQQLNYKLLIHASNSGAAIDTPELAYDYVRAGISLYGCYPSKHVDKEAVILKPAMELKTQIIFLKELDRGKHIGYGATYQTSKPAKIATLPVGYADGYNRLLSNRGYVLVQGQRAPIVGRVCMDQTIIDVTDIQNVKVGDEVVLFGEQNDARITVDEVADLVHTINYEVLCAISKRVPRIYR